MSDNQQLETSESIPWYGEEIEVATCSDNADSPSQGDIPLNEVETTHNAIGSVEDEPVVELVGCPADSVEDRDAPLREWESPLEDTSTSQVPSDALANLYVEAEVKIKNGKEYLCLERSLADSNQIIVQELPQQNVQKPSTSKSSSVNKTDSNEMREGRDKEKTPAIQLESIFYCKTHPSLLFPTQSEFKVHKKSELNCRLSVKCPICNKEFTEKRYCRCHQLTVHINSSQRKKEPHYTCYFCTATLTRMFNLETHLRIHTLEKPFKCEICQKTYASRSALDYHKNTVHRDPTKKSPFKCEICQKSYAGRSALDYHKNTVHRDPKKESPFKCEICQKSFSSKSALNRHKKNIHKDPEIS